MPSEMEKDLKDKLAQLVVDVDGARATEDDSYLPDEPNTRDRDGALVTWAQRYRNYEKAVWVPEGEHEEFHWYLLRQRWYENGVPEAVRTAVSPEGISQNPAVQRVAKPAARSSSTEITALDSTSDESLLLTRNTTRCGVLPWQIEDEADFMAGHFANAKVVQLEKIEKNIRCYFEDGVWSETQLAAPFLDHGVIMCAGGCGYEFRSWKDYAVHIGSDHRLRHGSKVQKACKFSLGVACDYQHLGYDCPIDFTESNSRSWRDFTRFDWAYHSCRREGYPCVCGTYIATPLAASLHIFIDSGLWEKCKGKPKTLLRMADMWHNLVTRPEKDNIIRKIHRTIWTLEASGKYRPQRTQGEDDDNGREDAPDVDSDEEEEEEGEEYDNNDEEDDSARDNEEEAEKDDVHDDSGDKDMDEVDDSQGEEESNLPQDVSSEKPLQRFLYSCRHSSKCTCKIIHTQAILQDYKRVFAVSMDAVQICYTDARSSTIPLMPFQYGQDRAMSATYTEKALTGTSAHHKRFGLQFLTRGVIFTAACFEVLREQDPQNRIIFTIDDGFTCEAGLLAWACDTQPAFKLHVALSDSQLTNWEECGNDEDAIEEWKASMTPTNPNYKGFSSGRHWIVLESKEIARVWKGWKKLTSLQPAPDGLVLGFLGWCKWLQKSKSLRSGRSNKHGTQAGSLKTLTGVLIKVVNAKLVEE